MKNKLLLILFFLLLGLPAVAKSHKDTFEIGKGTFLLNGEPFIIKAAELHYARIPEAYWEHPLIFKLMPRRGNSNWKERKEIMERFIGLFGQDCIDCLVADREFIGKEWIGWLNSNRIRYYIRIRQNIWFVKPSTGERVRAWRLFNSLKVGQEKFHYKPFLHKGEYAYLTGSRIRNSDGVPEFQILVCFNRPEDGVAAYKRRWEIETAIYDKRIVMISEDVYEMVKSLIA